MVCWSSVRLALFGCEQLTYHDVAVLARACHALTDVKLRRAYVGHRSSPTRPCTPQWWVQAAGADAADARKCVWGWHCGGGADHSGTAAERLEVRACGWSGCSELKLLVAGQLEGARCLLWSVDGPSDDGTWTAWTRRGRLDCSVAPRMDRLC
jgi:hypothetical protein